VSSIQDRRALFQVADVFEPDRRCRLSIGFSPLGEARGLWYELIDNAGRSLLSAHGRSGSDPEATP